MKISKASVRSNVLFHFSKEAYHYEKKETSECFWRELLFTE